jgi:hypothetical protein
MTFSKFVSLRGTEAFGVRLTVCVPIAGLTEAAKKLEGFPCRPLDTRELQFGAFGPEWAGGAAGRLHSCQECVRSFGHGLLFPFQPVNDLALVRQSLLGLEGRFRRCPWLVFAKREFSSLSRAS